MRLRPAAVAFDIIETVFPLEPLRSRLTTAGLPGATLEVWFAHILRDAIALDATDVYKPFREIASAALESAFVRHGVPPDAAKLDGVLGGFTELAPHPDAQAAFQRLHDAGIRIVSLTNGGAEATRTLLRNAGLERYVERTITVDEVRHWKPRREVYLHAAETVGVSPECLALVAAHAWDVHGAGRAGLTTAFVARGARFPAIMTPPHVTGETLTKAAEALLRLQEQSAGTAA